MKRKLMHLKDRFVGLLAVLRYFLALPVLPFLKKDPRYQKLWILAERGTDARDNGSHLFRYIRREHPEINIAYIIDPASPDAPAMAALGRVIPYGSWEHYLALAASQVKISTHIMGFTPDMLAFKELDKRIPLRGVKVFLQHGIIKDDIPYLYGDNVKLHLFVCGAKREWEYVRRVFGHPRETVQYLGLCRYDALPVPGERTPSRELLLMPTWRVYMHDGVFSPGAFMETDFYKAYQGLLTDPRLEALLEKWDYRLVFYPHHGAQKYLHTFRTDLERVRIVDPAKLGVQQALIRADGLITDYSSVYFDFAYMMKPVLYYQFDLEDYRKSQYQTGYFSYEEDGFGPVTQDREQLLAHLEEMLAAGCVPGQLYRDRIGDFFPVRDRDNCGRTFRRIMELWKEA